MALAGCPQADTELLSGQLLPERFDGEWQLASVGELGVACLRVSGGRIVEFDDGCNESLVVISNSQPAAISADQVVWSFVGTTPIATSDVTLSAVVQPDGSLYGTMLIDVDAPGPPKSAEFVMVRRGEPIRRDPSAGKELSNLLRRVTQFADGIIVRLLTVEDLLRESVHGEQPDALLELGEPSPDLSGDELAEQPADEPVQGEQSDELPELGEPSRDLGGDEPAGRQADEASMATRSAREELTASPGGSRAQPSDSFPGYQVLREIYRDGQGAVYGVAAFVLLLTGFAIAASIRAKKNRRLAESERAAKRAAIVAEQQATMASEFLQTLLICANPGHGKGSGVTVREVLDEAAERADSELSDQPEVEAAVRATIGKAYQSLGFLDEAEPHLRAALNERRCLRGDAHPDTASSLQNLANVLFRKGDVAAAERLWREAVEVYRRAYDDEHPLVATALNNLALALQAQGDYAEAETMHREALRLRRKRLGNEHPHVANTLEKLATLLSEMGEYAEAESAAREALALRRKVLGDEHPHVGRSLNTLSSVLGSQGKHIEAVTTLHKAVEIQRSALGEDQDDLGSSLTRLGTAFSKAGKPAEAERALREALEIRRKRLPEGHWLTADTASVLGDCLVKLGRYQEAEPHLLDEYRYMEKTRGAQHPRTQEALRRIIDVYDAWNKAEEAATYRRLLLQVTEPEESLTPSGDVSEQSEQGEPDRR
ncbi:MAG: tetratricopeptide repeat protein [Phycisphaerae bacterium]